MMRPFQPNYDPAPVIFSAPPDMKQLVAAINANTRRVQQVACDVRLRLASSPPLSGNLIVQRPDFLRLKAGLIGMSEMGFDIGSNDQEFWLWTKAAVGGQAPTMYYARYDEYYSSPMRQAIPIDPHWIVDAIGLVELDETQVTAGPARNDGRIELRLPMATAGGEMTKSLVVDPKTALVQQQSIYDGNGRLIAYLNAVSHQYFSEHQACFPRRIELFVIGDGNQQEELSIDLANLRINQLYGDPDLQWRRPNPTNSQMIDLSRVAPIP